VAASLSGGLDSSAIVGLAARQIAQNGGPPLRTYSFVFPNTPEADEAEYQREVLRAWPDVRGTAIPADDLWSFKGAFGPYAGREDEPNRWASQRALVDTMAERAASDGARVLLMGTFSDETLGTRTGLELLTSTSPWSWPEELRRLTAVRGFKGAAVEAAKAIKHRYFASPANRLAVLGPLARPSLGSFTADLSYLALFGGGKLLTRIASASRGDRTGLEVRFPFLDRDLVEFALALPVSLRLRGDRVSHKFVLRESMRGILPESVRDRRTKANVSHLDVLGFDREKQVMRQVAARSLAISSGWISESDADRLQLAAFGGLSGRRVNSMLTRLLEIETFLHEAHD
jgi:asparagine synthetase B (glutamine-hydrolysing)